jgi:hypothetical protein
VTPFPWGVFQRIKPGFCSGISIPIQNAFQFSYLLVSAAHRGGDCASAPGTRALVFFTVLNLIDKTDYIIRIKPDDMKEKKWPNTLPGCMTLDLSHQRHVAGDGFALLTVARLGQPIIRAL